MKEEKGETNHVVNTWVSITDYVETNNANTKTPTYMSIIMYIYNNYNLVIYNYNTIVCRLIHLQYRPRELDIDVSTLCDAIKGGVAR